MTNQNSPSSSCSPKPSLKQRPYPTFIPPPHITSSIIEVSSSSYTTLPGLVGFLGFKHDRKLALCALLVAASRKDVHGVFLGAKLFHVVRVDSDACLSWSLSLIMAGCFFYQGIKQTRVNFLFVYLSLVIILNSIELRYPEGALWILNRVCRLAHYHA